MRTQSPSSENQGPSSERVTDYLPHPREFVPVWNTFRRALKLVPGARIVAHAAAVMIAAVVAGSLLPADAGPLAALSAEVGPATSWQVIVALGSLSGLMATVLLTSLSLIMFSFGLGQVYDLAFSEARHDERERVLASLHETDSSRVIP